MKKIKKIVLKDAKLLSTQEMKNLFGGSGSSGVSCKSNGKECTLYILDHNNVWMPHTGTCQTLQSGGWFRCACVVSKYSSNPDKPSNVCN